MSELILSPKQWKSQPVAQILFEASGFNFEFSISDSTRRELQSALGMSKPQSFIYKTLLPTVCNESVEALIRRRGFKHLFQRTDGAREDYLRRFLGNFLEKLAKSPNKFGSLQVLKVLTNAICTPGRDNQGKEVVYSENEIFKLNHLLECDAVSNFIRQTCCKASLDIINSCVPGSGGNLLISLLLGLPHFSNKQVEAAIECFAIASIARNAIRYSKPSRLPNSKKSAKHSYYDLCTLKRFAKLDAQKTI